MLVASEEHGNLRYRIKREGKGRVLVRASTANADRIAKSANGVPRALW